MATPSTLSTLSTLSTVSTVSNRRVFVGTGIALIANIAIYLIGDAAGATWNVGLPFALGLPVVAAATIVPMLLGGQVVRLLGKKKPALVLWAAWIVLAFSIAGSPSGWIASQDLPTGLALGSMHVVVGLAFFFSIKTNRN
jgi:hypothetical protein